MNCDYCDNQAEVHEVTVKNGIKKEVHLCIEHAMEAGYDMPKHQPITQLLKHVAISHSAVASARTREKTRSCPSCDLSFNEFRRKGTLGCPDCYEAFGKLLASLIERSQNGATHHAGKAPKRAGSSIDRQLMMQKLLKELDSAVAAEQYERAAELRDQLRSMELTTSSEVEDSSN